MTVMRSGVTVIFCLVLVANGGSAKFVSSNPCTALQNGSKMPNTEDCSSYFVCEFNQMTKTQCDEGTLFDPQVLVCNWASLVECGETPILKPALEVTRRPVRQPVRSTTAAPVQQQQQQKQQPEPQMFNQDAWWMQNNNYWRPDMPSQFYPGFQGFPGQYSQFGLNYPAQGFNNQPEPVEETTTQPPTTRPTTVRTTQRRTTTPRTTAVWTTRAPPTRAPYSPPRSPSAVITLDENEHLQCDNRGLYFLAHPKNCENYYICTNGVMVLHQCASGIHWNEKTSQCDFPHRANCFANQRPASTPHSERPTPTCDGGQRFLAHETDCGKYYSCAGTTPTLMVCPGNFMWNVATSQCAEASTVDCMSQ